MLSPAPQNRSQDFAKEIERKFVVVGLPLAETFTTVSHLAQGYAIAGADGNRGQITKTDSGFNFKISSPNKAQDAIELFLRSSDLDDRSNSALTSLANREITGDEFEARGRRLTRGGVASYTFAIKCLGDTERLEIEASISDEQHRLLSSFFAGRTVVKLRGEIADGTRPLEVDVYTARHHGLVLAEREYATGEEAKSYSPPPWIGQEVTKDPLYKNRNLALHGLPINSELKIISLDYIRVLTARAMRPEC